MSPILEIACSIDPKPPIPTRRSRGSRARDAILTIPIALLLPAIVLLSAPAAASGPTLTADPTTIAAGTKVTFRASKLPRRQSRHDRPDDGTKELARYRVNGKGKFRVAVVMPVAVAAGKHTVRALSGSETVAELVVTVTSENAEPTPVPTPNPTPVVTPPPTPARRLPRRRSHARADAAPRRHRRSLRRPRPRRPRVRREHQPQPPRRRRPPGRARLRHRCRPPTPAPTTGPAPASGTILIDRATLMSLPMSGTAWLALKARADLPVGSPNLSNQDDPNDVTALAKALVYARTGVVRYRDETITMLKAAVGTEYPGDALGIARGVAPLVLAADLVGWRDPAWMSWLSKLRTWANPDRGYTLISMHEKRPNNWGTHAGAGRIAADLYLGDMTDLARAAKVFKGYLGDRTSYASFTYGDDLSWQASAVSPVGINPMGASVAGVTLDGIMPDDMRRGGSSPVVGDLGQSYTWEALQGTVLQAELLSRNGYPAWDWQNRRSCGRSPDPRPRLPRRRRRPMAAVARQPPLRHVVPGVDQHDRRQELRLRRLALREVGSPRAHPRAPSLSGSVASRQRSLPFVMPTIGRPRLPSAPQYLSSRASIRGLTHMPTTRRASARVHASRISGLARHHHPGLAGLGPGRQRCGRGPGDRRLSRRHPVRRSSRARRRRRHGQPQPEQALDERRLLVRGQVRSDLDAGRQVPDLALRHGDAELDEHQRSPSTIATARTPTCSPTATSSTSRRLGPRVSRGPSAATSGSTSTRTTRRRTRTLPSPASRSSSPGRLPGPATRRSPRIGNGDLWVAFTQANRVRITSSTDNGVTWSAPIDLPNMGNDITSNDTVAIATMNGGVGVLWSNQSGDG